MKNKILGFLTITAIFLVVIACEKQNSSLKMLKPDFSAFSLVQYPVATCGGTVTSPMIAGQDVDNPVGNVTITQSDGNLQVAFNITGESWSLSETHLSITATLEEVPGYSSNPKIGNFNYNTWPKHVEGSSVIFDPIPIPADSDNELYILAHGVVSEIIGWEQPEEIVLPSTVQMVAAPFKPPYAYFGVTISGGNPNVLDGFHEGWCFNLDAFLNPGDSYQAQVISSLDPLFYDLALIEKEENLFRVNWLLNNYSVEKKASDGTNFKPAEVQIAIWTLIEDNIDNLSNSTYSPADYDVIHIAEIVDAAMAIQSFTPTCGDYFAIVLRPLHPTTGLPTLQNVIIKYRINCTPVYADETAWAAGNAFSGDSWAMYFPYNFCK